MDDKKFHKGLYKFQTITGNKLHTFEIVKIQKNQSTGERRVFAKLDGGKEKMYPIVFYKDDTEIIEIPHWKTNVIPRDRKEENKPIENLQKELGSFLKMDGMK